MVSSNRLEPGATGQVKATVATAGRSGMITKFIRVYTNDRTNPVTTLTVNLEVVQKENNK